MKYHLQVKRVHYPGLKSHPEHHIATQQMTGFGGVVSFEVRVFFFLTAIHILFTASTFLWNFEHSLFIIHAGQWRPISHHKIY